MININCINFINNPYALRPTAEASFFIIINVVIIT